MKRYNRPEYTDARKRIRSEATYPLVISTATVNGVSMTVYTLTPEGGG